LFVLEVIWSIWADHLRLFVGVYNLKYSMVQFKIDVTYLMFVGNVHDFGLAGVYLKTPVIEPFL